MGLSRERKTLAVDHCAFPEDLLYSVDNDTWVRSLDADEVLVGVDSILASLGGKFTAIRLKQPGLVLQNGRSLGTLESLKFVGPIPSPLSGTILETNPLVTVRPKTLNDSPYDEGWICKLRPSAFDSERVQLSTARLAEKEFRDKIERFRVRCFKIFPDHEMVEVGVECAAVLLRLNDLIATVPDGDNVHVVSDDPTAYVEMERWTDETGNRLVDWRTEGNLFHFIVQKATK